MRITGTRVLAAAAVAAVGFVASGCLGPGQFDPTGRSPIGNLEVMVDAAGSVRVSGWAFDPDMGAPVVVKVGAEGVVHDVVAGRPRPDVATVFAGRTYVGFEHTFGPLAPGLRGVCVWVPNQAGAGQDRLLGCQNLQVSSPDPVGALESVTSPAARTVRVSGWVFDPNSAGSAEVAVTVNGAFATRMRADGYRPGIPAAARRSPSIGYATELAVTPGTHQVCVGAFNIGWGTDRLLGCRTVTVKESTSDRRPNGHLSSVVPAGGGAIDVTGVASDPDGSTGLTVRLDVNAGRADASTVVLPVVNGTFTRRLTGLADGLHTICAVGIDVPGAPGITGNRPFTCGTAVLGAVSVGTGGQPSTPVPVAPPAGHPLRNVDRDAGVSVTLSDGSVMWFFGDSSELDQVGNLKYFVNNTAAWAAPGAPTVTRDGVNGAAPFRFATPPAGLCTGQPHPTPALWPEAAVAIPQPDGTDRVVVYMSKVCLGSGFLQITPRGMLVVETTYDPAAPPVDSRISGTVTLAHLAQPAAAWGRAAVRHGGHVYVYQCGEFPFSDGMCKVARVPEGSTSTASAYRYWTGGAWTAAGSWVTDMSAAAGMTLPPGTVGGGAAQEVPIAAFTITRDEVHGAWVMAYSPFPGFTDRIHVRVAVTPVGPWTEPVTVHLPGCGESNAGATYWCYAGTAQPKLSAPGLLGLGYYDQLVSVGPTRGQYLAVTVPFRVVVAPTP